MESIFCIINKFAGGRNWYCFFYMFFNKNFLHRYAILIKYAIPIFSDILLNKIFMKS